MPSLTYERAGAGETLDGAGLGPAGSLQAPSRSLDAGCGYLAALARLARVATVGGILGIVVAAFHGASPFGASEVLQRIESNEGNAALAEHVPYPEPQSDAGSDAIHQGVLAFFFQSPLDHLTGEAEGDQFGASVAGAGDVNNDGIPDIVVGAPRYDRGDLTDSGRAYVFSVDGGPSFLTKTSNRSGDLLGSCVDGGGDVNGDGWDDVIVGAPNKTSPGLAKRGKVWVFSGATGQTLQSLWGEAAGDRFGCSVAFIGDADGDGHEDYVVGAWGNDDGGGNAGRAYVFSGQTGQQLWRKKGRRANDRFGSAVAGAGDVDGDGAADVIVGAFGNDDRGSAAGAAYVYSGTGPKIRSFKGEAAGDQFGRSVATAGDVNGDGIDDVIIGAPKAGGTGAAYVYSVENAELIWGSLWGDSPGDNFGRSVAGLGDVNNDNSDDVIIGAPGADGTGAAYVYSVPSGQRLISLPGEFPGDQFGYCVDGTADASGDGIPDLVIGARGYDAGSAFGRVYLFSGDPDDGGGDEGCTLTNASWSTTVAGEGDLVHLIVEGTDCDGELVSFEVLEWDAAGDPDDPVQTNPVNVTFVGGIAFGTWQAEWQADEGPPLDGPEYYFVATLSSDPSTSRQSGTDAGSLLVVCNADSDGDGTFDCLDACPDDPDKIEPGDCGCGVSDVDSDGDLVPDCEDECPDDPDKVLPGNCGCGEPEIPGCGSATAIPLGMNLARLKYYSSQWAFVDVMNMSMPWVTQHVSGSPPWNTGAADQLVVDEDGYPVGLPQHIDGHDQIAVTIMCGGLDGHYPGGQYICLYDGQGTLQFGGDAQIVSETPGRIVLNVVPTTAIDLKIVQSNPDDHVRNIRVMQAEFEDNYEEQIFHPTFLERLEPFSTLRFMNWQRTRNSIIETWSDRNQPTAYTQASDNGVAPEYIIALSNRLGADPWISIPHKADQDYVQQLAALFLDGLAPGRTVYLEYSNECWNGMFDQYHWLQQNPPPGGAGGANTRSYPFYADRAFDTWMSVWTGEESRVVRILAGQSGNPWVLTQGLLHLYDTWGGSCDAGSVAPYVRLIVDGFDANTTVDDVFERIDETADLVPGSEWWNLLFENYQACQDRGLRFIAYEGGQHWTPVPFGTVQPYLPALVEAQRDPRIRDVYADLFGIWMQMGNDVFCPYNYVGTWGNGQHGCWGHIEYQDEPLNSSPKFQVLLDAADGSLFEP